MGFFLLIALSVLAGLAVSQHTVDVCAEWEHRRFARSRLARLERCRPTGRAMVFLPCKGVDVGLEENLPPFLLPGLRRLRDHVCRREPLGPGLQPIAQLMADNPHRVSHLVIAGRAKDRRAEGSQPSRGHPAQVVVADRIPRLRRFRRATPARVAPRPGGPAGRRSAQKDVGAATGYRWLVPVRPTPANHLLYSINCGVATLLGSRRIYPVWGGSWAIRRTTFEAIGLRDAWRGTLSDDLVATQRLRRHGLGASGSSRPAWSPRRWTAPSGNICGFSVGSTSSAGSTLPRLWVGGLLAASLFRRRAGWPRWLCWAGRWRSGSPAGRSPAWACAWRFTVLAWPGRRSGRTGRRLRARLPRRAPRRWRFDIWGNPLVGLATRWRWSPRARGGTSAGATSPITCSRAAQREIVARAARPCRHVRRSGASTEPEVIALAASCPTGGEAGIGRQKAA